MGLPETEWIRDEEAMRQLSFEVPNQSLSAPISAQSVLAESNPFRSRFAVSLPVRYVSCYALFSTDVAYGAMRFPVLTALMMLWLSYDAMNFPVLT
eukprot:1869828-Rhodomonas_salina.1